MAHKITLTSCSYRQPYNATMFFCLHPDTARDLVSAVACRYCDQMHGNPFHGAKKDSLPSLNIVISNFATAIARWSAAGFPVVDRATFDARLAICHACPHWLAERNRCAKCGCHQTKLWLQTEKCPEGKW